MIAVGDDAQHRLLPSSRLLVAMTLAEQGGSTLFSDEAGYFVCYRAWPPMKRKVTTDESDTRASEVFEDQKF